MSSRAFKGGVYVVEGVPEAGKDRLVTALYTAAYPCGGEVHLFQEESVLASWRHHQLPLIHSLRLQFMDALVSHMQRVLSSDAEAMFVLNRFHVSYAMWRTMDGSVDGALQEAHNRLVARLHALPLQLFHVVVDERDIEARSRQMEAKDRASTAFLQHRIRGSPGRTLVSAVLREQQLMSRILEQDGSPFHRLCIDPRLDPLCELVQ